MITYTLTEKFGHGKAASRKAKVDEIDIDDDDGWTWRLWVNPGRTKREVAEEFLSLCEMSGDGLVLCSDAGRYWMESADPDLWTEDDNGDFTYHLANHDYAISQQ